MSVCTTAVKCGAQREVQICIKLLHVRHITFHSPRRNNEKRMSSEYWHGGLFCK